MAEDIYTGECSEHNVCVGVLSYNSEKSIIETLDSILFQKYNTKKIELIISDDCSIDSTCKLVSDWLIKNGDKFLKGTLISSDLNTGVSGNFNRLLRQAKSKWLKPIAADDLLMPECIADNVYFINNNPDCSIVFSNAIMFDNNNYSNTKKIICDEEFFCQDADLQEKILLTGCNIIAPTSFISTDLLENIGGADEQFPMIEDYPLWLKITKSGSKLFYNNVFSVYYRSGDSLSRSHKKIGNKKYLKDSQRFYKQFIWPNSNLIKKLDDKMMFFTKFAAIRIFQNKKTRLYYIFYICMSVFRPYRIFNKIYQYFIR